jgi:hypothetical protein
MFYHLFSRDSRKYSDVSSGLWILLLEAGVALALLAFIVWWTLPGKPKSGDGGPEQSCRNDGASDAPSAKRGAPRA